MTAADVDAFSRIGQDEYELTTSDLVDLENVSHGDITSTPRSLSFAPSELSTLVHVLCLQLQRNKFIALYLKIYAYISLRNFQSTPAMYIS